MHIYVADRKEKRVRKICGDVEGRIKPARNGV